MKLADCRTAREDLSSKASEITRKLGFAGIAVIWIFKTEQGANFVVPPDLVLPGLLIIIGLTLDFLQYVVGNYIWAFYHWHRERAGTKESENFLAPPKINWPTNFFFAAKIATMIAAYVLLAVAIGERL